MFSRRGHITLAHSDASLRTMRWRAEVNKLQGVDSSVIGPAEIKKLAPVLDTSGHPRYPILGALYHPPGGIIPTTTRWCGDTPAAPTPRAWRCTRRPKWST